LQNKTHWWLRPYQNWKNLGKAIIFLTQFF